ncbi:DNA translocase FtsK 4TM domain-containing protein [Candidatus Dependentiae bacterium]|nr:DNA translocase FtsK 4TM domain-containing protein [Candidatus Dependentiae bacterium]
MTKIKNGTPPGSKKSAPPAQLPSWITISFTGFMLLGTIISLISYTETDSSYIFETTSLRATQNILGSIGSNYAALLLYFFGCSAWLIPFILLYFSRVMIFNLSFKREIDRMIGFCAILFLVPTVAHCYTFEYYDGIFPGGWIGSSMMTFLQPLLPSPAIPIFLFLLSWALSVIIIRFSSISYLYPVVELLRRIPYKRYIQSFSLYASQSIRSLTSSFSRKNRQTPAPELLYQELRSDFETYIPAELEQPRVGLTKSPLANPHFSAERENDGNQIQEISAQSTPALQRPPQPLSFQNTDLTPGKNSYALPPYTLFLTPKESPIDHVVVSDGEQRALTLEHKLERFGIKGKVVLITQGPVVTLFEYQPSIDTKISTIIAREDDLALALQALSLRIIAPIPGRSVIGFEVAHNKRKAVLFSQILRGQLFASSQHALPLILGKDTLGNDVIIDLATMPHLLVAGSTGSGKSVGLHAMLMSLVCSKTPQEIKFILIDPKRLEFAAYADIPHLFFPIVTDPQRAIAVLKWAVSTMEDRYSQMAQAGVRNCAEFNEKLPPLDDAYLPLVIIIIDELADLMMTAGKEIETLIARLAQMARAAGIHLICATQRPSVDVITGLIKVNFPSRIAYKVTSKVDSRTILDMMGAEKLLGKGDMLFLDTRGSVHRVHGALVTDAEISSVVAHIKSQQKVEYKELTSFKNEPQSEQDNDEIFQDVINYVKNKDEISISLIQRVFRIGYNRSARIIEQLETTGYILPNDGGKMRKVTKDH